MISVANILSLIGKTPVVKLNRLAKGLYANVYVKLETFNPTFSVKDRAALAMVEDAEKKKLLKKGTRIIEASSGNMGISLACICAVKGYPVTVVMPENMSPERRHILIAFGAKVILTPASQGMQGALDNAHELLAADNAAIMLSQFTNKANPLVHYHTTAEEIWEQTEGSIDIFVAGTGTGGTISGVGKALKYKNENLLNVAVEPTGSPVLSEGRKGVHGIQGIGPGFIPLVLNTKVIDTIITVDTKDALFTARQLMQKEGIMAGISSGANVFAALRLAALKENKGKMILTIICDSAERYMSTELFED